MYSFSTATRTGVLFWRLSFTGQRSSTICNHSVNVSIGASVSGIRLRLIDLNPARSLEEDPKNRSGFNAPSRQVSWLFD